MYLSCYLYTEDEDEEGWAGHKVTEREVLMRSQRDADDRHRKEFERRRAKVTQHSLDLEGKVSPRILWNGRKIRYLMIIEG